MSENRINGFTLVETLIATLLFTVVIATVVAVFSFGANAQSKNEAIVEASQNARFIVEAIARDVRLADSFEIEDGNTITFTKGEDTYEYYLPKDDKENIYYRYSNGDPYKLTSSVTSVTNNTDNPLFSGVGSSDDDTAQSNLTIAISFKTDIGNGKTAETHDETIQTTVSTRSYNKGY